MFILHRAEQHKVDNGNSQITVYRLGETNGFLLRFTLFEYVGPDPSKNLFLGKLVKDRYRSESFYGETVGSGANSNARRRVIYTPESFSSNLTDEQRAEEYREKMIKPFAKLIDAIEERGELINLSDWKTSKDLADEKAEAEKAAEEKKKVSPPKTTPAS